MILQRTRHDFGCRSRAAIDQHDHRLALRQIAARGVEPLTILRVASARRNDLSLFQEGIGHLDRLSEQAARVVAQVQHNAADIVDAAQFLDRLLQSLFQVRIGLVVEGRHTQDNRIAHHTAAHRCQLDGVADDRDVERIGHAFAHDGQHDFRPDRPAHLFHGLVQQQPHQVFTVHLGDEIARLNAGRGCGRVIHGRDDFHKAVFLRDLDAQAPEFAARLHLHVVEIIRRQEA